MKKLSLILFGWLPTLLFAQNLQTQKYTVRKGETLYAIARNFGISPRQLCELNNGVTLKTQLKYGQRILVPAASAESEVSPPPVSAQAVSIPAPPSSASVHRVKKGETLYAIARSHSTTVQELKMLNRLSNLNVWAGQLLRLPNPAVTSAAGVAAAETAYSYNHPQHEPDTEATPDNSPPRETAFDDEEDVVRQRDKFKSVKPIAPVADVKPDVYEETFRAFAASGYKPETYRGKAALLSKNGSPLEAYYDGLTPGTLVRVTNMLNRQAVVVKVAGKVAPQAQKNGCLLLLSKDAAQAIGASDENFMVEVNGFKL